MTDIQLQVDAIDYGKEDPLRLREAWGDSELPDGTAVEITRCMSGTAIYFRTREEKPRQVAVPIQAILQAVGEFWENGS